jgi:hypothetical protein
MALNSFIEQLFLHISFNNGNFCVRSFVDYLYDCFLVIVCILIVCHIM